MPAYTRCRDDGVECVVRPRANAAILTDDLRWQQSVEMRLQSLNSEIDAIKAKNAELQRQLHGGAGNRTAREHIQSFTAAPAPVNSSVKSLSGPSPPSPPNSAPTTTPHAPLPSHLNTLRDILQPALAELERPTPLDVSIDDATILWE